jgi:hypothetical protein
MFIEKVIGNVKTVVTVVVLSKQLAPKVQSLFKGMLSGKFKIAIFGAGGTGKTTLGNILAGKATDNNALNPYQESSKVDILELENIPGLVFIVPGQENRQDKWDEVFAEIQDGQINLIINVVSYGYHSFRKVEFIEIEYQKDPIYQVGMDERKFTLAYIEQQREREISALQAMESYIKVSKNKKVLMLTLITKQDLWWHSRSQVKDYYQNGYYNQIINSIQLKKGTDGFHHEYISASLSIENFICGKDLIWPNSEGYDERLKISNMEELFNKIVSLCDVNLR